MRLTVHRFPRAVDAFDQVGLRDAGLIHQAFELGKLLV